MDPIPLPPQQSPHNKHISPFFGFGRGGKQTNTTSPFLALPIFLFLMHIGSSVSAPSRHISPVRSATPPRRPSPLNPLTRRPRAAAQTLTKTASTTSKTTTTSTLTTHLSNLDRLLQRPSPGPPPPPFPAHLPDDGDIGGDYAPSPWGFLNALNLAGIFPAARKAGDMSPRSLNHLQRILSNSPRPSPRNHIGDRWRELHGAYDWKGLLDPLDENLRRELVRYGEFVQAAYHAFHSNPAKQPSDARHVVLPDRSYRVTRNLYATSVIEMPRWVDGMAPWMTQRSSWIGYVAVCDNDREIQRMGRRDIVISLRGTATCLEWAENFRAALVKMPTDSERNAPAAAAEDQTSRSSSSSSSSHVHPKVECGFWSLFKTGSPHVPSLSEAVVEEVRRLMEVYKGEPLSITVTGHSLGAALAVLVADELSTCAPQAPPIAVFSFGGPHVGNRGFADRVRARGVKVLRVVNQQDVITRVPGVFATEEKDHHRRQRLLRSGEEKSAGVPAKVLDALDGAMTQWTYSHVGSELRVDSRQSPYLRPNADPGCCHDLEAYLHLVDGFLGSHCPFRSNAKRSIAKLMSQQGSNIKRLYTSNALAALGVETAPDAVAASAARGEFNCSSCLPSPSSS